MRTELVFQPLRTNNSGIENTTPNSLLKIAKWTASGFSKYDTKQLSADQEQKK
jgi:hypothetical protein